jgi:hypothetical protein
VIRKAIAETGVDVCLDVHGDETIPYNFIANTGITSSPTPAEFLRIADVGAAALDLAPDTLS